MQAPRSRCNIRNRVASDLAAPLWKRSLSNLNLIAVGPRLKYECAEETVDRMLLIIQQRGSSNWNGVPLFMKRAWRGKSDGPNKRVLMEGGGRRGPSLSLICFFSRY